jgi:neutral ceramidase
MKKFNFKYSLIILILIQVNSSFPLFSQDTIWQVGVARVDITPTDTLWLAGYAARDHASEGTLHKLWAKAFAVKDKNGNRGVLITTDLLGFPKNISDNIVTRCQERYQLTRSQIILNSSHTHTGPVVREGLYVIYPLSNEHIERIETYSRQLENDIVRVIGQAFDNMTSAELNAANGVVRFQVNRRNNNAKTLSAQSDLNGPNDFAVPVLQARRRDGNLLATVFGYACHPTVLSSYQWSGDYPGFAQLALEDKFPGATALFFQGCGADQNPLPRRSLNLARQYGQELAAAVERVIHDECESLASDLRTGYTEVDLAFTEHPTQQTLQKIAADSTVNYKQKWAQKMLNKLNNGESLPTSYPYPIQIWKLGDQSIFALGGEVVVDYAITLKRLFGQNAFVMGYCNDVMGYIPSVRVLREGGYEGVTSQIVYDLPGTWKADIEAKIIYTILQLAKETGIELPESQIISN